MGNQEQKKPQDTRIQRAADRANELRKRGKHHCQAVSIAASEFGLGFDAIQRELVRRAASHRIATSKRASFRPQVAPSEPSRQYLAVAGSVPAGDR